MRINREGKSAATAQDLYEVKTRSLDQRNQRQPGGGDRRALPARGCELLWLPCVMLVMLPFLHAGDVWCGQPEAGNARQVTINESMFQQPCRYGTAKTRQR